MVDFTIDVFRSLHPGEDAPAALGEKREDVVRQLNYLQQRSSQVIEIFSKQDVTDVAEKNRDSQELWNYLGENYNFQRGQLEDVFHYGKFM